MASRSSVIRVEPDLAEAFNTAPKRRQELVKSAMRSALKLVPPAKPKVPCLSKKESGLFLKINRSFPDNVQQRYDQLLARRRSALLSRSEREELLRLTDEMEQMWVERLEAIVALATLRRKTPEQMLKELEIEIPQRKYDFR